MEIKVLGPGCPKCHQTEKIVKEAVTESGVTATVEKVTESRRIRISTSSVKRSTG